MKSIRIGSGAGFGGDRIEPAIDLMKRGGIDYIIFECLAERTIALGQLRKLKDANKGYNDLLEYRMEKVLPLVKENKVKVITNMGAANPIAAMNVIKELAKKLNVKDLKIAAVVGDDVKDKVSKYYESDIIENNDKLKTLSDKIISANAYIGAEGIVEALKNDADIIVTGRVADPSLVVGPLIYEFGWDYTDYELLGKGTLAGHLLECAAQVMGGYFADPPYKVVPELWNLGFPIGEINENGDITISKLDDVGGLVTVDTVKEQVLYEIQDPTKYFTPNVVADFSKVTVSQVGKDKVLVENAGGSYETDFYKTSIGYKNGYIGEGEISYGGLGAYERAQLAGEIIKKRLEILQIPIQEVRVDYIGVTSLYGSGFNNNNTPNEVRVRVAARTESREVAEVIGNEVEALYTNGPTAGGGVRKYVREIISVASVLIPKKDVEIDVYYEVI